LGNLRHYVGIYDPEVGEFTITECHKVTLRSTLRPTQEDLDEEARQRDGQTYTSMRMSLGQEFGTKKAKKGIADATVNAINQRKPGETAPPVDAAQQAMLDSLNVKTEGMMTAEERQKEVDNSKPRPEPDMDATSPADVYPLENLVSEDDLGFVQVREWQQATKKGENVQLTMRYVARRLQKVATSKDAKNLKLLKYVHIMLTWFVAMESNRGGGRKLPQRDKLKEKVDAPAAILDSLRKKFSDGQ
jgi:DNA-directed RNA polymerase I subunit RPA49